MAKLTDKQLTRALQYLRDVGRPFLGRAFYAAAVAAGCDKWSGAGLQARMLTLGLVEVAGVSPNGRWRLYRVRAKAPARLVECPTCGRPMDGRRAAGGRGRQ